MPYSNGLDLTNFRVFKDYFIKKGILKMITGIKKINKVTQIFFDEENDITTIQTYNTALKNRLTKYASEHPELCRLTDDDGCGQLCFDVRKEYFTFRLLNPCSEDRKQKAREQMKAINKTKFGGKTDV